MSRKVTMIALLLVASAWAGDPSVDVSWTGADGRLLLRAPVGEHVALDAPLDLSLRVGPRTVTVAALGTDLRGGVAIGELRGQAIHGEVVVSLCEDGGSRCRQVALAVQGEVPQRRRGVVPLSVGARFAEPERSDPPWRGDAEQAVAEATERARVLGASVLIDFGAVWCPPCQLLDAEVLATPLLTEELAGTYVLARVDVDDPSSWPVKDAHEVGGYPTLVVLGVDGAETARLVGYPGRAETEAWLRAASQAPAAVDLGDPHRAAEAAWQAVREEREARARALLEQASGASEDVAFRLARWHLDPSPADAVWLADRAPGRAIDWVLAGATLREDPTVQAAMRRAIDADLATADPLDAADLLYVAGDLTPALRTTLAGAAAALVRGQLVGDPIRDKGLYGWLATLLDTADQVEEAVVVLQDARRAFPDEPTFHASLARLYLRHDEPEEALQVARAAHAVAWGDNRLTAAALVADALVGAGQHGEARTFLDAELAAARVPGPEVDVRTPRYVQALEERRARLDAP